MNTILKILALPAIVTGCIAGPVENNTTGNDTQVTNSNNGGTDSSWVSVVFPSLPERTITVGGPGSDIRGFTSEAIQTAVDALHGEGGGRIKLSSGDYDITAPVRLYSNMSLTGAGITTVLKKCRGYRSPFALDADYGELHVTVADASGFTPGMGVAVFDDVYRSGWDVTTARVAFIRGNTVYLDDYLLRDYKMEKHGMLSNGGSVVEAVGAENLSIGDLLIDGDRQTNDLVDGCRAGGIYLHKVKNAVVENVTVRNVNCDGISWQITEHVTVKNCEVYGCANAGLHPGTGSPFTLIEGNNSHDNNGYGLFVCWRVRNGRVINNHFARNGKNGISTGHKDTDMLFEGNEISENREDGIYLRGESDLNAPHGSLFRGNTIENNGTAGESCGIAINCRAKGVIIENNIFRNGGSGREIAAVILMPGALPAEMHGNTVTGLRDGELIKK
jgi:Right handed beta helix region